MSPAVRAVAFNAMPEEPLRQRWLTWMKRHGIDGNSVAVPGGIECNDQTCQVTWRSYVRNAAGRLVVDPATRDVVMELRTVQLEGPAMPMPYADGSVA